MDNLIRTDTVFGKRVNMVGNISADLVLESLGKIYIKSRNKSQTLEELITSLVLSDPNTSTSRVKILEGIEGLDTSEFNEGTFVFDKLSNILYLFIDGELMELINVAPEGTGYVKRSGDVMTGRLAIYVKDGPPLYVNSAVLVPNLNAEYLNGETAETFTRRHRDEKISGAWTFKAPTYFKSSIQVEKDIVINGSIGSPNFASGFGGYGWRMDADTNTLTVDNLVVRKLMKVYELVVNKISATNGSLWVSNAGKVVSAVKLDIKPYEFFNASNDDYLRYIGGLRMGDVLIKMPENPTLEDLEEEAFATASGDGIVMRDCYSSTTLASMKFIDVTIDKPNLALNQGARFNPLFETGFRFNCTFPIITRNDKQTYDIAYEQVQYYKDTLSELILSGATQENIESIETQLEEAQENANPRKYVSLIRSYYKYFAGGDYYYVRFDDNNLPVFKAGDLLRCQKWTNGGIKYYDALVCNYIGKGYVLQLAPSFLDKKTTIKYDNSLNPEVTVEEESRNLDLYKTTRNYKEPDQQNYVYNDDGTTTIYTYDEALDNNLIGMVEVDDSLVQMGHLWDKQRQNAVYITSTDDAAPYMDVLSGINRPDYSVNYHIPVYKTVKLFQHSYSLTTFVGFNNLVDIPYTGDYYVQDSSIEDFTCEYVCFKHNNTIYLAKGKTLPQTQGVSLQYYLNIVPDKCTSLGEPTDNFYINLENGGHISFEDNSGSIIQEKQYKKLTLESTKTIKARLGNLDGIQDELFPIDKQPCGYGLYGQNVYLTGEFFLSNGQAVADLGKDAMAFAIAASREGNAAINLLRADLVRADNLLKASHYNKGTLKTAGMYIGNDTQGNPGIVIWGNKILFATTDLEFSGKVQPTMLLADGKIQGKYLGVDEAHGTVDALVLPSEFTIKNGNTETKYTSNDPSPGTVRVYKPKIKNVTSDGTVYYTETDQIFYVRRFMVNNDSSQLVWLLVNPDGYPQGSRNDFGEYTSVDYPNITYYDENNTPTTYSAGILPSNVESDFVANYTTPLKVWSLEKNGKGNVGGATLYWNSMGKVVVNGILYSTEGNIGGFNLGKDALYTLALDVNNTIFNPIIISSMKYEYYEENLNTPYIELNKAARNGGIRDRVTLTPSGLFYIGNTGENGINGFVSSQVPSILFCLTVIPIYIQSKETWTLYARLSCGMNVFQYIDVTYDQGIFALNFQLMEMEEGTATSWGYQREWFLDKLAKGQVHFLISGYNSGYSNDSNADVWHFNLDQMYQYPSHGYSMSGEKYVKANIAYMSFKGTNHSLNANYNTEDYATAFRYLAKIRRTEDKSLWSTDQQTLIDGGGIFYWGYKGAEHAFAQNSFNNYILIETSDDASRNWGGFNLTALYIPTFDDRFIENTQVKQSDYNEEAQQALNNADAYRTLLIQQYGTNGTYVESLETALQTKIDGMTSEQLSSQSSAISSIRNNIQSMISYANDISVGSDLDSLEIYASNLSGRYTSISIAISNLESGSSSESSGGDLGTYQYSVGLLSDLHLNTDDDDVSTDAGDENDLANALSVFKQQGVAFICTAGDVMETYNPFSNDSNGDTRTLADAKDFYNTYSNANSGLNFFSPLGNHDYFGLHEKRTADEDNATASIQRISDYWRAKVQAFMGSQSVTYLSDSNNLTYYFTRGDDIYIILSLDYGGDNDGIVTSGTLPFTGSNYRDTIDAKRIISVPSNDSNVNAILEYISDTNYNQVAEAQYNYQFYSPSSLIWLKNLIESNTNKKIFVFTHHFLPHKPGNSNGIPSNGYAYGSICPSASHSTTSGCENLRRGAGALSGMQFWFINKLNNKHKNVYWFSGHSHLTWNYNSDDALKCAHIDNHDYNIVTPTTSDYSSDNSDPKKKTVYTKSSMSSIGNSGWWIALPSLSKPRSISGSSASYLYDEAEISIMDVYTNGIKIKGYKTKRANSSYNLEKLVEKNLLMDGTEAGSGDDSGGEVIPSSDGLTFNLTNSLDIEARFTGEVILNISKNSTDWANSTQVYANMSNKSGDPHINVISIPPGGTYSWTTQIETYLPGSPSHSSAIDGTWYIMSQSNPNNNILANPIYMYTAHFYGTQSGKSSEEASTAHGSNSMYLTSPPDNTLIQNGGIYNFTLKGTVSDYYGGERKMTLQPDKSGYYVVLGINQTPTD